ncbi:MAG: thiol-disulfide oxidoreductase DCC family protein [Blastocatellia bacterium]
MIERGREHMLFDGDCGICAWSAELVKRMDRKRRFRVEPYQAYEEADLRAYGIDYADCARALQVITRKGRVYGGALGVNYFLWRQFPWTLLVILIYAVPILFVLELIGYRLVADHRQRLSIHFGLKGCKWSPEPGIEPREAGSKSV